MNWKYLIENIDKSKENRNEVDLITLGETEFSKFDIPWLNADETPLKSYWYAKWYCTDTWVGGKLYFFDDEFIASSWQSARKASENFQWASKEAYEKVSVYLESIRQIDEIAGLGISFHDDLEQEIEDGYMIEYSCNLLNIHRDNQVIIKETGDKAKIVETWTLMKDIERWRLAKVELENGEVKELRMDDIKFPYLLK